MSRTRLDRWLGWGLRAVATLSAAIVGLVFFFMLRESMPALTHIGLGRFAGDASWHPAPEADQGTYNLIPMAVGTLAVSVGALVLATPVGIGSAIFCHAYAPRPVAAVYRRMIELLAGIPSVVYGLWGLVVLVPLLAAWRPPGASLLAGILILSLMVLPTVMLTATAALSQVPLGSVQAATALGFSRWAVVRRILLPTARAGLLTGVVLAAGRALGETMAVLMVCGNVVRIPETVFDPIRTLAANIALEMAYAQAMHHSALFVCGLVLVSAVAVLVGWAEWMSRANHV